LICLLDEQNIGANIYNMDIYSRLKTAKRCDQEKLFNIIKRSKFWSDLDQRADVDKVLYCFVQRAGLQNLYEIMQKEGRGASDKLAAAETILKTLQNLKYKHRLNQTEEESQHEEHKKFDAPLYFQGFVNIEGHRVSDEEIRQYGKQHEKEATIKHFCEYTIVDPYKVTEDEVRQFVHQHGKKAARLHFSGERVDELVTNIVKSSKRKRKRRRKK